MLGEAILAAEPKGGTAVIDAICRMTKGEIIGQGQVTQKSVNYTKQAFDVGTLTIGIGAGAVTMHVMNEYMAVDDAQGLRLAGFPDVIATLNRDGVPVSVGEIREGDELLVLRIAKATFPSPQRRRSLRLSRGRSAARHQPHRLRPVMTVQLYGRGRHRPVPCGAFPPEEATRWAPSDFFV